jgi:hypothetical protein
MSVSDREALLGIFRNRGWLSPALVSALLADRRFGRSPAGTSEKELVKLQQAGLLVGRRIRGGLLLFRARRAD